MGPTYQMTLVEQYELAENVVGFRFSLPDKNFQFIAGQFISLQIPWQQRILKRSYSIASTPVLAQHQGLLEISVALVEGGRASQYLTNMQPGDQLEMAGPYGRLILPEQPPKRIVLVGTGTGIAPYRAMLPELRQLAQQAYQIDVVMGIRTPVHLFYHQEFTELAAEFSNVHYWVCFSREISDQLFVDGEYLHLNDCYNQKKGYVQTLLPELKLNSEETIVFLCGNPAMIDEAATQLQVKEGFSVKQVRREKYVLSTN
ncbi:ferredoxin--NADP reductase [Endozoicomonas sp. SM1973]|uniref:Ferredoxin--NADP reductase n=1 Tax=Spartinivicinus marinus TaxID=2994442 RepID=A0A853I7N4_9GAMM|nr:FAD-binding oxidoreductase [Spartinivicinus marinus]MCX4025901.1 FAD-binding oxidoreductase [Spartinivicinus marinus]NYZ68829.1 ferredoxin--NADP reductase [Spartinivicinus marinus]